MAALSRNHVTVTGRTGGPLLMPTHGLGCDRNARRLVVVRERDVTVALFDHVDAGRCHLSAWRSEERCSANRGDLVARCRPVAPNVSGLCPRLAAPEETAAAIPAFAGGAR
ncbi:hypothetical protein AB0I94_13430 [Streptomyces sp. NPDC050147]|uniref:hypothetical protein n=1 Tax=Streptomyces sp. NPDC050147 TaxID=3155513 RepID=UPI003438DEE1